MATSTVYPAYSVTEGFLYYDFFASPAIFALEYINGSTVTRTDIVSPCNVQRKIACPRKLFQHGRSGLYAASLCRQRRCNGRRSSRFDAQQRRLQHGLSQGRAIAESARTDYRRVDIGHGSKCHCCAARAQDGTLYELFKDTAKAVPGVNLRFNSVAPPNNKPQQLRLGSTALFDFKQFSSCSSPTCNA